MARAVLEIDGDAKPLERELNRADQIAEKFAHKVAFKFQRAFGYGFAASELVHLIPNIFEHAEAIDKTGRQLRITTDEVQLLQHAARDAGMEFEEYMTKARESAVDLEEVVKRMRERGIKIVSSADIQELAKDKHIVEDLVQSGWARVLTSVGAGIRGYRDLKSGEFKNAGLNFIRMFQGYSDSSYFGFNPSSWASSKLAGGTNPPGTQTLGQWQEDWHAMRQRLGALEQEEYALKKFQALNVRMSGPALTDREQGGAYVSRGLTPVVENQLQDVNDHLEVIAMQEAFIRKALEQGLQPGGQPAR